ncbi:hypothetical protein ACRAWD_08785 [Caulobacter segnis]
MSIEVRSTPLLAWEKAAGATVISAQAAAQASSERVKFIGMVL